MVSFEGLAVVLIIVSVVTIPAGAVLDTGDLLAEPTLALLEEGTAAEIAMSVHAHPTLSEVLAEAAMAVDGAAIHV
jgi:hypothetical protein